MSKRSKSEESKEQIKVNKKVGIHSLRTQVAVIFMIVMAASIMLCWFLNNFFLEDYYINNKIKTINNVYSVISDECENGDINSEEFDITLQKLTGTHNVSLVIVGHNLDPMKFYSVEPQERLLMELQLNLTESILAERVIDETDKYILIQRKDSRLQTDILEMWGVLPDDSFFMIRTTIESIRISSGIASRFLLYTGIGVMVISGFVIFFVTKRISRPILELSYIAEKMSEMDFETKYLGKDKNEVGVLGRSINSMSDNLEKTIEDLRTANIELQKDNELKTLIDERRKEFISNVSHELKTPIALIQGYAEGLKEGINEAEERDYYCDVIIDESSKMNTMVKKLMTLNSLEEGAHVLSIEEFNLSSLVKNYVQSIGVLANQNEININVNANEDCIVRADEFKIEEVLMNYLSNAINHCESDSDKRIDVNVKKDDNNVIVSVYNTGKNIPDESIDRLWEKFYKVDKARTRQYGGSGVGLSIVKAIMDAHNGEYGVRNEENGVTFWFSLKSN